MACSSSKFRDGVIIRSPWLLLAAVFAPLAFPAAGKAADVETRDFRVFVDGKPAGDAHMTFNKQDDGTITMSCDTDVKLQILIVRYTYSYRGREVWKAGRLQSFSSTCNDNGSRFEVAAAADGNNLRIQVNRQERLVPGDVWLTSYWSQPDAKVVNKTIAIVDADNGHDLTAKVTYIGAEQVPVAGQLQPAHHYRLEGKTNIDLWYDATGRLVRQNFVEQNHRTVLELAQIRR